MAETAAAFRTVINRAPRITVVGTIVIEDFENEMKVTKVGECLESEVFTLKGEPFVVEVYTEIVSSVPYVRMRLSNRGIKEVFVESIKMTVCGEPGELKTRVGVMPCTQAPRSLADPPAPTAPFYTKDLGILKSILKDGVFEAQVEVELLGDRIVTSSATPNKPSSSSNQWVLEQLFRDLPGGRTSRNVGTLESRYNILIVWQNSDIFKESALRPIRYSSCNVSLSIYLSFYMSLFM